MFMKLFFHITILIHMREFDMFFPFQFVGGDCREDMRLKMISEPSTSDAGAGCPLIKGIQLSSTTKEFDVKECILCQQHNRNHNVRTLRTRKY